MNNTIKMILAAALCLTAAACAKKEQIKPVEEAPPVVDTTTQPADSGPAAFTPADLESDVCLRQRVVYFDLDQSTIKREFQDIIACHAKYLTDRPGSQMTLDGHADERGSRDYNLGLGERRGNAVRSALVAAGASMGQIDVISHGEEQPMCREHNEACWSKNRRVEISYSVK